ncbi:MULTISPECIES: ATP-grasp domain-containing protein [unclassified Streptomyces]|uniref:ATP-grasp domain-containing protein n=1 Tax=unclassified Streptomyces TaxID=2593676 RepID=UPI001BE4F9DA|nr:MULTISPECIES: ATP-grasp domain-containing protein [unclassified Streptomyces]MBT2406349.1 ATP-grasp domain-containing protein [Streptomyces sp. ISL-21]MBT2458741.1 ATP-grasp domain-containing protein [Streptomyces sp. ISL-86]MBT2607555.1 ATP-grasp domain-containing protein [Streptomyces sp. ISL-87]
MSAPLHVVIVDSYAPTKLLADEFRKAGATLVRVQSTREIPKVYEGSFSLDDYVDNIVHGGDLAATAHAVAAYSPVAVVAGGEVGVEFADALSSELGLPTNGVGLSEARRDKYVQIETVKAAGLAGAYQSKPSSAEELAEWHRSVGGRIVVKPLRSAAGDGIFFCDTPEESAAAFDRLVGATNVFSDVNTGVVAQEYLRGTEYMVNTVSLNGRHHVTDIWRTTRISANGVIDLVDAAYLMQRRGEVQDQLAAYAAGVLDALGIQHGPAHVEVKMTSRGPVLVEMGARICGGNLPHYAQVTLGESQLDLAAAAYLDPERFLERCGTDYPKGPFMASVTLVSPVEGVFAGFPHMDELEALESFNDVRGALQPGQPIHPTVNDMGYPLMVTLLHESEETVLRDANTIRYLDGPGFYALAADGEQE